MNSVALRLFANDFQCFVNRGLSGQKGQPAVSGFLTELFKSDGVQISTLELVNLLSAVEDDQLKRLPFPRTPSCPLESRLLQEWMTPELAAHYIRYAAAAYGASYVYMSKGVGALSYMVATSLVENLRTGIGEYAYVMRKCALTPIEGWLKKDCLRYFMKTIPDNIVDTSMTNIAIFKHVTGLTEDDLVYVTYQDELEKIPFFVCLDHKQKSVVVALRGSISKDDWLTDFLLTESKELPAHEFGGVTGIKVHDGMLKTALYIKKRLLDGQEVTDDGSYECGLLSAAWRKLEQSRGRDQAKDYKLVITGHSLGAGVAAVLALLMKQTQYSDLKCFAFSPPGCLLSMSAADLCTSFVYSVVLGDDIVGRAKVHTLLDLKISVLKQLRQHPHKAEYYGCKDRAQLNIRIDELIDSCEKTKAEQDVMYLPGCIMFLQETQHCWTLLGGLKIHTSTTYAGYPSCSREDAIVSEIMLSGPSHDMDMIRHHIPWLVMKGLDAVK